LRDPTVDRVFDWCYTIETLKHAGENVKLVEKIAKLEECIALLDDVDAMQQSALVDSSEMSLIYHTRIQDLISDFESEIEELEQR